MRRRAMSSPATLRRVECWGCGVPVYHEKYNECRLCCECLDFYRPIEAYYDIKGWLWGYILD